MSLTTTSESNNDAGVFVLTAATSKYYEPPTSVGFLPRTFPQGGVATNGTPVDFHYAIVGMHDNEGFAVRSFCTCMVNMMLSDAGEEIASLVASGETFDVDVGKNSQTTSSGGAYHRVKASTTKLARRVANGAYYQTFDDVRRLIDRLVTRAEQQTEALIGPETNHDFRVNMRNALFRMFLNADSKTAINYTHGLLLSVASAAITAASVGDDGKISVTWNPEFIATLPSEAPDSGAKAALRLLYAWARQAKDGFTVETADALIQTEPTDGVLSAILNAGSLYFNGPWGDMEATGDDLRSVISPSGDDFTPIPDYVIASATDRILYVNPEHALDASDEFDGCARFEDNTNCLAIAMQLGAVSQSTVEDVIANLGCVSWSEKDLKKKLNSEHVTVTFVNKELNDVAEAWVPKFDKKDYRLAVSQRADAALTAMFGAAKQPAIPTGAHLPVSKDGTPIIIIHEVAPAVDGRGREKLYDLGDEEGLVDFTDTCGFASQIAGPIYQMPLIISGGSSSLTVFRIKGKQFSPDAVADLLHRERAHCVERYKEMVQNGAGDPPSGGEEPASYGWLALLAIPILGIILAAIISHNSPGGAAEGPRRQASAGTGPEPQAIVL